ncbi:uncharacterized protein LOC110099206 [Dendrobium catenatum]|uniref:uncharacterized protein LOC110099206 n=1 Tax=Dendrobium catenatum TaxID=906689 RepID=UPI0009F46169|nr:uncharacterized protein LOC110099206 [Dendrobium catenatum]
MEVGSRKRGIRVATRIRFQGLSAIGARGSGGKWITPLRELSRVGRIQRRNVVGVWPWEVANERRKFRSRFNDARGGEVRIQACANGRLRRCLQRYGAIVARFGQQDLRQSFSREQEGTDEVQSHYKNNG